MITVILIIFLLIIVTLAISLYCYYTAFYSPPRKRVEPFDLPDTDQYSPFRNENIARVKRMQAEEYESVGITSHDGLKLTGKLYLRYDDAPIAVCVHGWRSSAIRDFCGGAFTLMELGCNVLLVDQRAQGDSEGLTMTFGIKERFDILGWVKYLNTRFPQKPDIFLYGVSMGAATVLMASGMELPDNVRCVVADCPYSSPPDIIKKVCRDLKIPPAPAYPFLVLAARLFGRFDLSETTAELQVQKARIPIMVIHGTADRFVPCEMSAVLAKANPLVERYTFEGAGHGISFLVDQPRYEALVRDLTNRVRS